jgi:hypothetical protein
MRERPRTIVRRRDLLGLVLVGTGAAVSNAVAAEPGVPNSVDLKDKRRTRYQANSAEVREFYRVNAYPAR